MTRVHSCSPGRAATAAAPRFSSRMASKSGPGWSARWKTSVAGRLVDVEAADLQAEELAVVDPVHDGGEPRGGDLLAGQLRCWPSELLGRGPAARRPRRGPTAGQSLGTGSVRSMMVGPRARQGVGDEQRPAGHVPGQRREHPVPHRLRGVLALLDPCERPAGQSRRRRSR